MGNSARKIEITNLTSEDVKDAQIRITKDHKYLFPKEKIGTPVTHELTIRVDRQNYIATYSIGSKDSNERSGVLRLGADIYRRILDIRDGSRLKISKTNDDVYLISKF